MWILVTSIWHLAMSHKLNHERNIFAQTCPPRKVLMHGNLYLELLGSIRDCLQHYFYGYYVNEAYIALMTYSKMEFYSAIYL